MKLLSPRNSKLPIAFLLTSSFTLLAAAASAQVIPKPGAPNKGSEFGLMLDRFEQYTLVSAESEGDKSVGDYLGAVWLFDDSRFTPTRMYQFSPDPNFPREVGNKMNLGIAVGMSETWIAMGIGRWAHTLDFPHYKTAVALVRKANGSFPSCPTDSLGTPDCRGFIEPLFFDDDPVVSSYRADRYKFNIAVSNQHLVVGFAGAKNKDTGTLYDDYGHVKLLTYNSTSATWESTATISDLSLDVGVSVAVDDNKAVIAAPVIKGYDEDSLPVADRLGGRVVTMRWNYITKTWARTDLLNTQNLPYFANTLAMSGDTLVVGSGFPGTKSVTDFTYPTGNLSFYRYINDEWVLEETITTERAPVRVAVHHNSALISLPGNDLSGTDSPVQLFQGVENASLGGILRDWQTFGGVRRAALDPYADGGSWNPDGVDLSNGAISVGWRAASARASDATIRPNVGLIARDFFGAFYESDSEFTPATVSTTTTPTVYDDGVARLGSIYASFSDYYPNFNGSGYMALSSGNAEWLVTVPSIGTYKICMRYANGISTLPLSADLVINRFNSGSISAPPTGGWDVWSNACVSKHLVAGVNQIRMQGGYPVAPNIDGISVGK